MIKLGFSHSIRLYVREFFFFEEQGSLCSKKQNQKFERWMSCPVGLMAQTVAHASPRICLAAYWWWVTDQERTVTAADR